MSKYKVQLRGGFSDRMGIKPINTAMQTTAFDTRTRTALFNIITRLFDLLATCMHAEAHAAFYADILSQVYVLPLASAKTYGATAINISTAQDAIQSTINNGDYDDVLTILEYLASKLPSVSRSIQFTQLVNALFEKEYVGYRFVNNIIVPISSSQEIAAIEEALKTPYDQVNTHTEKALGLLSDRQSPDYENSIKESISAVERMCSIIVGKSTTLYYCFFFFLPRSVLSILISV